MTVSPAARAMFDYREEHPNPITKGQIAVIVDAAFAAMNQAARDCGIRLHGDDRAANCEGAIIAYVKAAIDPDEGGI